MTTVDVLFRFGKLPNESVVQAVARLREVYGVRRLAFHEAEMTVRVEFDSTRLSEEIIHQLLRRAGLDVGEKVPLFASPTPAEAAPAT